MADRGLRRFPQDAYGAEYDVQGPAERRADLLLMRLRPVAALCFMLVVSLVASAGLSAWVEFFKDRSPARSS